jgi:uncharacterized protein YcgI (DUF1989 family)
MEIATRQRIEPQTGVAFELKRGDLLRVIDVQGEQVSDLMAFAPDRVECLSSGRSIDYNDTIYLTTGHVLYSNRSTPMLTIVEDSVGRHDILYAPCSPEMFQKLYGYGPDHPSCFFNLAGELATFGVEPDRIGTTFNIFMNAALGGDGSIKVIPPISRAGDSILFRAETDLIVALTACSAELSNNWSFKPIEYEITRA